MSVILIATQVTGERSKGYIDPSGGTLNRDRAVPQTSRSDTQIRHCMKPNSTWRVSPFTLLPFDHAVTIDSAPLCLTNRGLKSAAASITSSLWEQSQKDFPISRYSKRSTERSRRDGWPGVS